MLLNNLKEKVYPVMHPFVDDIIHEANRRGKMLEK